LSKLQESLDTTAADCVLTTSAESHSMTNISEAYIASWRRSRPEPIAFRQLELPDQISVHTPPVPATVLQIIVDRRSV
jgi:hypothetical protein